MRLILLMFVLVGCQTNIPDASKFYRKNMDIFLDGKHEVGTMVVEPKSSYNFDFKFPASIEKLKLNTCHRYVVEKKVGKKWRYRYVKSEGIEDKGICSMHIGAFDDKSQNSWGLIEFKNDKDLNLAANMVCNGKSSKVNGVSICQSQISLRQKIEFLEPVKMYSQDECRDEPFTYDNKTWFFDMIRGDCVFVFANKKLNSFHRMRTFGYDDEL